MESSSVINTYKALTKVCPQNETNPFCVFGYFLVDDDNSDEKALVNFLGSFRSKDEALKYGEHLIQTTGFRSIVVSSRGSWFTISKTPVVEQFSMAAGISDRLDEAHKRDLKLSDEKKRREQEIREENENLKDPKSIDSYSHVIYQLWRAHASLKEYERIIAEIEISKAELENKKKSLDCDFPEYKENVKEVLSRKLAKEEPTYLAILNYLQEIAIKRDKIDCGGCCEDIAANAVVDCQNGVCVIPIDDEEDANAETNAETNVEPEVVVPEIIVSNDVLDTTEPQNGVVEDISRNEDQRVPITLEIKKKIKKRLAY